MIPDDQSYETELAAWRAQGEAALRAPNGWLSVAGLFWLKEGTSRVGSDPRGEVLLPAEAAPGFVGELCLRDGVLTIAAAGNKLLLNGETPSDRPLRDDGDDQPDQLSVGQLDLQILRRGQRVGIRVRNPAQAERSNFPGRRWYPPRPDYRVQARFVAYDPPKSITIVNILGDAVEEASPGYALFSLEGHELRLDATEAGAGLSFLLRDRTSGAETYGAGRMLRAAAPHDGMVELDFNRAYNPPCAFTPYATCPLPPPQNHLPVPIPAGELAPPDA